MKKVLFIIMILVFTSGILFSQAPDTLWMKTYGGPDADRCYSAQETTDKGFILAGKTYSYGAGFMDFYVIKVDMNGDTIWTRTFGDYLWEEAYSVYQTNDEGYIVAGYTDSFGAGGDDIYCIRLDAYGDTIWTKTYGGNYDDYGYSVQQTSDNNFIIVGETWSFGSGTPTYSNIYLLKIDAYGDTIWTKTYGGTNGESGRSIQQTNDEGYIITGFTNSYSPFNYNVYMIKLDKNGNITWSKNYCGNIGYSVRQVDGGGYVVTGNDIPVPFLLKTNALGDSLWINYYSDGYHTAYTNCVRQTSDNEYVLAGMYTTDTQDAYMVKTDVNGDTIWTKTFGGTGTDIAHYAQELSTGGYILAGYTNSFGAGSGDFLLIKLKPEAGVSDENINNGLCEITLAQNKPNPFNQSTKIFFSLSHNAFTQLKLYNIRGQEIQSLINELKHAGNHTVEFNMNNHPSGIYIVKLQVNDNVRTRKILLMK